MLGMLYYAYAAVLVLVTLYVVSRLVFHAYFTARTHFINTMINKAKELSANGKE